MDRPICLSHPLQLGRILLRFSTDCAGNRRLGVTFGLRELKSGGSAQKRRHCLPSSVVAAHRIRSQWYPLRKKFPDTNKCQTCHPNEQDFCFLFRKGKNMIFLRQNPNFNNRGMGGGIRCEVLSSWEIIGKNLNHWVFPVGFFFCFIF